MKTFYSESGSEWKRWLEKNHRVEREIWLIFCRKGTKQRCIAYDEALGWALCYGWIDSVIKKIDDEKYARKFTPRRIGSVWSKSNIDRMRDCSKKVK